MTVQIFTGSMTQITNGAKVAVSTGPLGPQGATGLVGPQGVAGTPAVYSNVLPVLLGIAAAGVGNAASREDHVHPTTGLIKTVGNQTISGITTLLASAVADVPLLSKGVVGQTGDLQQWQSSVGTVLAKVDAVGRIAATGTSTDPVVGTQAAGAYLNFNTTPRVHLLSATSNWIIDNNNNFLRFITGGAVPHQLTSTSALFKGLVGIASQSTTVALIVQAAAAQTADLQQWQNSAVVLAKVTAAGLLGWSAGNVQTTVGAAGAASALPLTPTKYLKVVGDNGVTYVVPAYAAS